MQAMRRSKSAKRNLQGAPWLPEPLSLSPEEMSKVAAGIVAAQSPTLDAESDRGGTTTSGAVSGGSNPIETK